MIEFTVYGVAQPAGSKRAFPGRGKAAGRAIIVDDNRRSGPWKAEVAAAAAAAITVHGDEGTSGYLPPLEGPLELDVGFHMPRPKGHYGKRGLLPSAPDYPIVKPDTTKLLRGLEDALTGICYRDDAQIVRQTVSKEYADSGPARVEVRITAIGSLLLDEPQREET